MSAAKLLDPEFIKSVENNNPWLHKGYKVKREETVDKPDPDKDVEETKPVVEIDDDHD